MRRNGTSSSGRQQGGWSWQGVAAGVAAGVTAAAVASLLQRMAFADASDSSSRQEEHSTEDTRRRRSNSTQEGLVGSRCTRNDVPNMASGGRREMPRTNLPNNPVITNLNGLLSDIYVRYIAIKDEEFELHYRVFTEIFRQLHKTMKEVDKYYNQYSSTVQFAGSHPDGLRISRPDNDFDVDIVIGLPLNFRNNPVNSGDSDIVLEPKGPGYVQLKMGVQFQRLFMRDEAQWLTNKTAYEWKDEKNYLLRSKFITWFKSVVSKALNKYTVCGKPTFIVGGERYEVGRSEGDLALTLLIKNAKGFRCDVDLVPALSFPEDRWPVCDQYSPIPKRCNSPQRVWMVVPKPNEDGQNEHDTSRSWRIALQDQEAKLMHDAGNMKQAIRFIKKLRDSMGMEKIASYYIKTLFFWEIMEQKQDKAFWSTNNPAFLFHHMVKKLYAALVDGKIPYFWNKRCNLIGDVDKGILRGYANKLSKLIEFLEHQAAYDYRQVAKYLLSADEFVEYNKNILHIA